MSKPVHVREVTGAVLRDALAKATPEGSDMGANGKQAEVETHLALRPQAQAQALSPHVFEPQSLGEAIEYAKFLANAKLVPTHLRGSPADIVLVMARGRELGIPATQALGSMFVIEGKVGMDADMIVGMVKRHPEVCRFFRLVESTDKVARYETHRVGEPAPVVMEFTIEDAARANLLGKSTWKQYPKVMLRHRCAAQLAREVYQDLVFGLYERDEIEEVRERAPAPTYKAPTRHAPIDVEAQPVPPDDVPSIDVRADVPLEQAITSAQSDADLRELVPAIKAQPKEEQDRLRSLYAERAKALKDRRLWAHIP